MCHLEEPVTGLRNRFTKCPSIGRTSVPGPQNGDPLIVSIALNLVWVEQWTSSILV